MPNIVSYTISLKDKYSRISDRVRAKSRAMRKEFKQTGKELEKVKRKYQKLGRQVQQFGGVLAGAGRKLTVFSGLVVGMGFLAVREAARMETLSLAYEVFIGDVVKSKKVLGELILFADRTPFQVKDIAKAGKLMMAYGLESSQLLPTMKKLGDLSAGTGSNLQRVALVHGQILAMNRLQGRDNLQLAQMGINVIEPIAKRYSKLLGRTVKQAEILKEMERSGGIPLKDYLQAIDDLTTGTGRFKGMTERLAASLIGRWSTLVDSVERMGREVGKTVAESVGLNDILVSVTASITSITDSVVGFTAAHPGLTKMALILAGMAIVFGPIILGFSGIVTMFGAMIALFPAVVTGLTAIAAALGISVGAILLIPLAIGAAIVAFTALYVYWDDIVGAIGRGITHLVEQFQWLASEGLEAIRSGWSGKALEFFGIIEATAGDSKPFAGVNENDRRDRIAARANSGIARDLPTKLHSPLPEDNLLQMLGAIDVTGGDSTTTIDPNSNAKWDRLAAKLGASIERDSPAQLNSLLSAGKLMQTIDPNSNAKWDRLAAKLGASIERDSPAQLNSLLSAGKLMQMLGAIDVIGGDSTTTVDVNLNAPRGAVGAITSRTTGTGPAPNIGLNMATAR